MSKPGAKVGIGTMSGGAVLDSECEQVVSEDGGNCDIEQPARQDVDVRGLLTHKKEEFNKSKSKDQLTTEVRFNTLPSGNQVLVQTSRSGCFADK